MTVSKLDNTKSRDFKSRPATGRVEATLVLLFWGEGHHRLTETEAQQFLGGCDRRRWCYRPTKANVDPFTW